MYSISLWGYLDVAMLYFRSSSTCQKHLDVHCECSNLAKLTLYPSWHISCCVMVYVRCEPHVCLAHCGHSYRIILISFNLLFIWTFICFFFNKLCMYMSHIFACLDKCMLTAMWVFHTQHSKWYSVLNPTYNVHFSVHERHSSMYHTTPVTLPKFYSTAVTAPNF